MARPKAKKKVAKTAKPTKARSGTVKKAVAAVKKAVAKKKTTARPAAKKAPKTTAGAAKKGSKVAGKSVKTTKPAKKKAPAKKATATRKVASGKATGKAAKPVAKKVVARKAAAEKAPVKKSQGKPAAKKSSSKAQSPTAVAKPAVQRIASALMKNAKIGKTLVRTQAASASQAPHAVRPASATRGKPGKPLDPSKIPTEAQLRRAPDSQYMNDTQLAFFQQRLLQMRSEVLAREVDVKERLHQREIFADPADRASAEEEHWLDLRLRERESLLLKKIDEALRRIRDKDYGYCEKTGEPIGIARLLARPTATVCVDVKGQDERAESQYRDR